MLILSPDQNPLYRPSPTSPAGPTFYVDLATPDAAVKEAMEGNNIQVCLRGAKKKGTFWIAKPSTDYECPLESRL